MHRMLAQDVRRFGKSLRSSIAISSCFPDETASAPASSTAPGDAASGGSADIPKGNRQQRPAELRLALGRRKTARRPQPAVQDSDARPFTILGHSTRSSAPHSSATPVVTATACPPPRLHFELDAQLSDTFCNNSLTSGCQRA